MIRKATLTKRASAVIALCVLAALGSNAQTLTTLFSFNGANGGSPYAGLAQATTGYLYGTTSRGGANGNYGTVFKVTPNGVPTTLYSFCAQTNCGDGEQPVAGLIQATNGNLFGTTFFGGAHGLGTVFRITPSGMLTTLYSFCSLPNCADGQSPSAGLIQATNGDLYGTTEFGGAHARGTVFKITPGGPLTTLYSFCSHASCADGSNPEAGLVQATDGDLYGTTNTGGAKNDGTVFKMTLDGALATLYSFCSQPNCADGLSPYQAALVQAADGNLYGTTESGGANFSGTVFRMTTSGALTTLYSFCSQASCADGANPYAGLVQATDGNLYGTTYGGGAKDLGTIFEVTLGGALTTLYSFCSPNCAAGFLPYAGLAQMTNGDLYGAAATGGAHNDGTVFRLSVGLGPFVASLPAAGRAGAAVKILGNNLTGAASVTFNGASAAFTVASPTLITTTVPTGATTGVVQVVTPSGTLSSNVPFRVLP